MPQGMRTSYTDTTPQKRVVADMIKIIDPRDIPLITLLGLNGQRKFRFVNFPGTKVEWLEDSLSPTEDTLAAAVADGTTTSITVSNAEYFQVGHVIQIDNEQMWVSAVNTGTNVLTVTRGYGGTTAAAHNNGTKVYIRYVARQEGAESDPGHSTTVSAPYNYSQIFHKEVKVSGTNQVISKYGIDDEYRYQLMKIVGGAGGGRGRKGRAGELMLALERTAFYGKRVGTDPRSMGGLDVYITTNTTDANNAALTQKMLEDTIQSCWEKGGMPDTIVCNGWLKRKITSFYSGAVRQERRDDVGGMVIETISTEFGELDILLDRWCPADKLYVLQKNLIGWATIRPFAEQKLAVTGDYIRGQVVGEYTFVVCNEQAHGVISNLSTSK